MTRPLALFDNPDELPANALLATRHYLGPVDRGDVYRDQYGILVFGNPNSRRLPHERWLELLRWLITSDQPGAGTRQWAQATRWLRKKYPQVTTVVSYSDPSVGHNGALYRASNWRWAPTWHRLRTPPTGNGDWGTGAQAAKDRWVFLLLPDDEREELLAVDDESLMKRMPWASYTEPRWRRGHAVGGGGDYKRWLASVQDLTTLP